ncbi:PREDICTED: uncharacterized protein LOC109183539 [Ipomoea nil]|uniref:uncharacterized protein LOC109183539 n=1 Tax=Ipomoea nil TaxID=35883 RepID=UPI000900D163|nr:PREDICTED: uncharacterized protein LOC109183539 [Ipomoea nil]XP_019189189.1 PREDICTED: uncharacterized protein LOC109183539 [Ipomoea nil]
MAKQSQTVFLEVWLQSIIGGSSSSVSSRQPSLTSAQAIIQAWADLRDSVQQQAFNSHNLQSLHTLVTSQNSLYIADPQAKLLLSLMSSPKISLPQESYSLLLKLLYIWIRKSSRPSSLVVDYAVEVLLNLFSVHLHSEKISVFYSEGVLLLGALSFVTSASEKSRKACLEMLCMLLEQDFKLICMSEGLIPNVLAGIGYALSCPLNIYFVRILGILFGVWDKTDVPLSSIENGLLVLHLTEWVLSNLISSHSSDRIDLFKREILESPPQNYASFAVVMAAAGVLRTINRTNANLLLHLRIPAEERIAVVAGDLISRTRDANSSSVKLKNSFLLQCVSLALSKCGTVSHRASLLFCLAEALLTEIFPLQCIYTRILESHAGNLVEIEINVQEHLHSTIFKEAGSITAVFCNQYVSSGEVNRSTVENLIWDYCQDVYLWYRQVALMLQYRKDGLSVNLEKIAESAFLMVVVFALAVTKHKLGSGIAHEDQLKLSVQILVSFSCMEYFRRMRLQEYMDVIRAVITSVQENESACVSFVKSMPSYANLTNKPGSSTFQELNYSWSTDEVQTARMLFYLRVIPTCIECMPASMFGTVVAPIMFLYMGHPTRKVARASHSVFVAFISSGKDPNHDERVTLKEKLVFYYVKRSLEAYPDITPFEGVASGVTALVRHLPAGSPSIFYCIHSLVEKVNSLCSVIKNWEGEIEPTKKMLELLLRLLSLVDIQVLPSLMRLLAQMIVQLPTDGQNMVLNDLYQQIAELDDVTRKPALVSWVQSLSYLCSQDTSRRVSIEASEVHTASIGNTDTLSLNKINARL